MLEFIDCSIVRREYLDGRDHVWSDASPTPRLAYGARDMEPTACAIPPVWQLAQNCQPQYR